MKNDDVDHPQGNDLEQPVSKTQRKKAMQHAQDLGEQLLSLSPSQLQTFDLESDLLTALDEARQIKSREALRRQKQFIGKLMRKANIAAIESRLTAITDGHQTQTQAFKEIETLRDSLISGGRDELNAAISRFPRIDTQKLRQLTRKAKQELTSNAPLTSKRELFRLLRSAEEETRSEDI